MLGSAAAQRSYESLNYSHAVSHARDAGVNVYAHALKQVFVQSMQGGPTEARCNQIQFEITLEMDSGAWTYASCDPQPGDPSGKEPLRPRKGTLTPQRRASVEVAYAKMREASPGRAPPMPAA